MIAPLLGLLALVSSAAGAAEYRLSILPMFSAEQTAKQVEAIATYLSEQTNLKITPVVTANFADFEGQIQRGTVELAYENPYIYIRASEMQNVIAMANTGKDGAKLRGVIVVRADSGIVTLEDLRGKRISVAGYSAAGGYLSQKLALMEAGIDVDKECHVAEALHNKHENVLMSVYYGEVNAGFVHGKALDEVADYIPSQQLNVMGRGAWLPNWAFSAADTVPEADRALIRDALLNVPQNHPMLQAIKANSFQAATDADYDSIRRAAGMPIPERAK